MKQRSLESILQDLRRDALADETFPKMNFNQHRRQFLDRLRDTGWVASSKLPDTPQTVIALLRLEWIERRDNGSGTEYRITHTGLAELCMPR